jgi:hypothetical protein
MLSSAFNVPMYRFARRILRFDIISVCEDMHSLLAWRCFHNNNYEVDIYMGKTLTHARFTTCMPLEEGS